MSKCLICAEPAPLVFNGKYYVNVCSNRKCNFIRLKTDRGVSSLDHPDYYPDIEGLQIDSKRPFISVRAEIVARFVKSGGSIADLGCGLGETAINLAMKGFRVWGVDESKNAIAFLQTYYPDVFWAPNTVSDFLTGQKMNFDAITLFHVLEHVHDPKLTISQIKEGLNPGGIVLIEVPDVRGGLARFQGVNWEYWLDHHLNYFSLKSLYRLMEPLGFKIIYSQRMYHFGYPQGILLKDLIHASLAMIGFHSIIRTVWKYPA